VQSWNLDPTDDINGWLVEWSGMCQERPDSEMVERLKTIAMIDLNHDTAHICRGTVLWLQKQFEEALVEYEKAVQIDLEEYDAYFWKGMTYASLERDEEAIAAIKKALELDCPPILLTPISWFNQNRPSFYEKYGAELHMTLSQSS
jgi:tetratricopeptide (TPR) repeat protein